MIQNPAFASIILFLSSITIFFINHVKSEVVMIQTSHKSTLSHLHSIENSFQQNSTSAENNSEEMEFLSSNAVGTQSGSLPCWSSEDSKKENDNEDNGYSILKMCF